VSTDSRCRKIVSAEFPVAVLITLLERPVCDPWPTASAANEVAPNVAKTKSMTASMTPHFMMLLSPEIVV
jgi:hypothetical protein